MRLIAGVLARWPWIAIGAIIFGTLGAITGIKITKPSYALAVSLIKRRTPQTVQTSESGQAFKPSDLNDATLLATLLATEPLDMALKRSKNGVDPTKIRKLVEASQLEGTDIFFVTYHSPISPQDAVDFTTIWADEINAYTQRLQQTEAHEVRIILQKEVADLEKQTDATNLEILNFSKAKDYLGGEAQVSAALSKLSQIELQLETARTTSTAKEEQLKSLMVQIQHQSPLELQLRTAKEELATLRATYTDTNPLVQAKLQSIEYLSDQLKELDEKVKTEGPTDLDSYTGTVLGNQIYLSIIELRNQLSDAHNQIQSLEKLYATTSARIAEFPGIVSAYDALASKRKSITEGLTLMNNRLKEAEIFASGAPGYWQLFQAPDTRRIVPSSFIVKPAMLGVAGAVAGAGIAILLTLMLTHRSPRRSVLECCAATKSPLVANIPNSDDTEALIAVQHFWITHLAPRFTSKSQILFWTAALDPEIEKRLWSLLATAVFNDTGKAIRIHDLTPDTLWAETGLPDSLDWFSHPQEARVPQDSPFQLISPNVLKTAPFPNVTDEPVAATLYRANSLPQGQAREVLGKINYWMAVVSGRRKSLRLASKYSQLTDAYLPPCDGAIAWIDRPEGVIRQGADSVSAFLAKRFS